MRYIYFKDNYFIEKELLYYFKDDFNDLEKKAYDSAVDYHKSSTDDRDTTPTNVFLITKQPPPNINGRKLDDKYYLVCTLFQNESDVLDMLNAKPFYNYIVFESDLEPIKVIYNIIDIIPEYFL